MAIIFLYTFLFLYKVFIKFQEVAVNSISGNFINNVQIPVYTEPVNTENRSVNIKTDDYYAPEKIKLSRRIPDTDTIQKSGKILKKTGNSIKDFFDDILNTIKRWKPKNRRPLKTQQTIEKIEDLALILNNNQDKVERKQK